MVPIIVHGLQAAFILSASFTFAASALVFDSHQGFLEPMVVSSNKTFSGSDMNSLGSLYERQTCNSGDVVCSMFSFRFDDYND